MSMHPPLASAPSSTNRFKRIDPFTSAAVIIGILGIILRIWAMTSYTLWVDEAESSINGLTILDKGLPLSEYLGQPIYENTLTEPWPEHPEYEFKDSSYSDRGLVVYHGWLPLYAIAAAHAIVGIEADQVSDDPHPKHSADEIFLRTVVPRSPAILFSAAYLFVVFVLIRKIAGPGAALTSLTWLALGFYGVRFGHQARYYSLTLLMSALCAWAAWQVYRRGKLRDYVFLALAEAGLFHTHQLSAAIFAATCLLLAPRILQQRHWFRNCAVAAAISASLTIPWAILSGFFATASDVPKGHQLFGNWFEWIDYVVERPAPLFVVCVLIALVALSLLSGRRTGPGVYPFLIFWMVVAYLAFHFLVPAASLFFERLTLICLTPLAILMGMAFAEFYPKRRSIGAVGLSIALPLGVLWITNDLPRNRDGFDESKQAVAEVIDYFEERTDAVPRRIYSTPNQHLVWTYYLGIPVQSIAPVRRSFLRDYDGHIFFLESNWIVTIPDPDHIHNAFANAGALPSEAEVLQYKLNLSHNLVRKELIGRGFDPSTVPAAPLPDTLQSYFAELREADIQGQREQFERSKRITILQDVETDNIRDLWLGFFYRFADYPSRIGANLNIRPIQEEAQIQILPASGITIFHRKALGSDQAKD